MDIDLFLSLWHVCTFFPPFLGLRGRESVEVSIPAVYVGDHSLISHHQQSHKAKWLLHPCLHLYPPLNPFLPPSLYVIPHFPSYCLLVRTRTCTHARSQTHTSPPFLQTDANRLLVLLMSVGVLFEMNLYTSAPELTSIGLNSFNNHDICLLAYLLSKQAQTQLASWETVTLTFVCVRKENVIAAANINSWEICSLSIHGRGLAHNKLIEHTFMILYIYKIAAKVSVYFSSTSLY